MKKYNPLPDNLTIKKSKIHGLGLFAKKSIKSNTNLGLSHKRLKTPVEGEYEVFRTPLGGFVNHSEEPNCQLIETLDNLFLHTMRNIKRGEELTLEYQWYKVGEEE